ncbi:hypothetical protein [Actinomyces wuliandei]|uniref:hypothetical protein n=1 Tax=Actinomyces wuliandei TaxID=2057743 RepID=UPI000FDAC43F|nr:hypothetical protein [Actinomyces wuliandei]
MRTAVVQGDSEDSKERYVEVGGWGIPRPFHVLVDESEVDGYSMTAVAGEDSAPTTVWAAPRYAKPGSPTVRKAAGHTLRR